MTSAETSRQHRTGDTSRWGAADAEAARGAIAALLAARAPGGTVCPSEVARRLAAAAGHGDWRGAMPFVHAAVDALLAEGDVRLSWKGAELAARRGPYRIARAR